MPFDAHDERILDAHHARTEGRPDRVYRVEFAPYFITVTDEDRERYPTQTDDEIAITHLLDDALESGNAPIVEEIIEE